MLVRPFMFGCGAATSLLLVYLGRSRFQYNGNVFKDQRVPDTVNDFFQNDTLPSNASVENVTPEHGYSIEGLISNSTLGVGVVHLIQTDNTDTC